VNGLSCGRSDHAGLLSRAAGSPLLPPYSTSGTSFARAMGLREHLLDHVPDRPRLRVVARLALRDRAPEDLLRPIGVSARVRRAGVPGDHELAEVKAGPAPDLAAALTRDLRERAERWHHALVPE